MKPKQLNKENNRKKVFYSCRNGIPWFDLCPFPLVYLMGTSEKGLIASSLIPPITGGQ